jgi:hypothetical protein
MRVRPVEGKRDLRRFIFLPNRLYGSLPQWVPPLRVDILGQFSAKRNPFLRHCETALFLLEDERGRIHGRIAAFIDWLACQDWKEEAGLFGYFDCDEAAGREGAFMLLDAARDWLAQRRMKTMRGPWSFVSQEWGSLLNRFDEAPVVMCPWNPASYNEWFEAWGLGKVKDLLAWEIDAAKGYHIPPRFVSLTDKIRARYGITLREVNLRRLREEIDLIQDLSNDTLLGNWGFSTVTPEEVDAMVRDLSLIVNPKGVIFAQDSSGKTIGFAIVIPDANVLFKRIKGRLFPFGWIPLLTKVRKLRRYRMFGLGVIKEYQGKGVDAVLYCAVYENLYSSDAWMEINYVLEDNWPMVNAIDKLQATPSKRYRVYIRDIAGA